MDTEPQQGWNPEWGGVDRTADWLAEALALAPPKPLVRCIHHTRLVIRGDLVPSGTRYAARPQQIIPVEPEDFDALLSMTRKTTGCRGCHGSGDQPAQHYFEEV